MGRPKKLTRVNLKTLPSGGVFIRPGSKNGEGGSPVPIMQGEAC